MVCHYDGLIGAGLRPTGCGLGCGVQRALTRVLLGQSQIDSLLACPPREAGHAVGMRALRGLNAG